MQSYAAVVLLAATVFGHVNARATSGTLVTAETNNEVTFSECPHKAVPGTIFTVPYIMLDKLHDCTKPSAEFQHQLGTAADTDAYRRLFQSACSRVPAVKTCIAAVDADAEACLGEAERKLWTAKLENLDASIADMCADGSEVVATIFGDEFKVMRLANKHRVLACMYATLEQTRFDREADLPAYTLRKYRAFKSGRECILNVAKQGQTSANQFKRLIDKLIKRMKCLTPVTNEIAPCETLDTEDVLTTSATYSSRIG